jgi:uncharacterized protein
MLKIIKNHKILTAHNRTILADIYLRFNNENKAIIFYSHGYKAFKDWGFHEILARYFAEKDFVFVKFNFSHNGTNQDNPEWISDAEAFGNNNIQLETEDLHDVIDWFHAEKLIPEQEYNAGKIYLLGHSRGGVVSLIVGSKRQDVKKIASWGIFSDFEKIWREYYDFEEWEKNGVIYRWAGNSGLKLPLYYQLYANYLEHIEEFSVEKATKSLNKPFLVIHGTEDDKLSFHYAVEVKKWNLKVRLSLYPGCNHNFGATHPYLERRLPFDAKTAADETIAFFRER